MSKKLPDFLVIGDTHLQDKYPGYLDNQVDSLLKLVKDYPAYEVVFLGDIFHKRSPSPTELIAAYKLFSELDLRAKENDTIVNVIMGNHDAQYKADDGTTALSLLEEKCFLYTEPEICESNGGHVAFIPHYENEQTIIDYLPKTKDCDWVFGHFGYNGCINSVGNYDFSIDPSCIPAPTVLGHIHEYKKYTNNNSNITILGTPYQTDYLGQNAKRYIGLITGGNLEIKEVQIGPKYVACGIEDIEKEVKLVNNNQYLIVRLFVDKFNVENLRDLRKQLMETYPQIKYLDIRFTPELKDKSAQSTYAPTTSLASINEIIIMDYLSEKSSNIPQDELLEGLKIINENQSD